MSDCARQRSAAIHARDIVFLFTADSLVLDGTNSWGSGGRALTVTWALAAGTGDSAGKIQAKLDAATASQQYIVTLTPADMGDELRVRLSLTVSNFLGLSDTVNVDTVRRAFPVPSSRSRARTRSI